MIDATTFDSVAAAVEVARDFGDIFGARGDDAWFQEAKAHYRQLSLIVHPDMVEGADKPRASDAFAKLGGFWAAIERGEEAKAGRVVIKTKKRSYTTEGLMIRGDIANVYRSGDFVLKMSRSPKNNDLMQREAKALKALAKGDEAYRPFVPVLFESFRHREASTSIDRRVNVLERLGAATNSPWYSLAEVRAAYAEGLDSRHVAWIWRRLLTVAGFAHQTGYVHGAIFGNHVMIEPKLHALVLVDWCYSTPVGERVPAVITRYKNRYPSEVLERKPATSKTDIFLITGLAMGITRSAPSQIRAFANWCRGDHAPADAWEVLGAYDELIDRLWPRKFMEFPEMVTTP